MKSPERKYNHELFNCILSDIVSLLFETSEGKTVVVVNGQILFLENKFKIIIILY